MAIVWKINGQTPDQLGIEQLVLKLCNQAADVLTFNQPGAFDGEALFDYGDDVVLTRQDGSDPAVTWFRGIVRVVPRRSESRAESIAYEVRGGWDLLERRPYLQTFKEASDASNPSSTLVDVLRGRVVLGQDDSGAKVNLATAVADVVGYAVASGADLQAGTISLAVTVPWDESTDLSCADVISRLLQWVPSAVVWFDYTVDPPAMNVKRRSALAAVDLAVHPLGAADDDGTYAPLESVLINPRYDLKVDNVALIYIATNRANEASWETTTRDVYPPGTTGREEGALTRTIQLAGSVYNSTVLQQTCEAEAISDALVFSGALLPAGGSFSSVAFWWKKRVPWLKLENVSILGFRDGTRTTEDGGDVNEALERELLNGSVTDWMEAYQGIEAERQRVTIQAVVEITDPVTSKVERTTHQLEALILATNAQTRTYSFLQDESFTPGETAPVGLASSLHGDLSVLQFDGSFPLLESECSKLVSVGNVVNLTGALAAWETMKALVQQAEFDLDNGRTSLTVGPPKHLGPDDLVELYRVNRNRQPVTSYLVRTGGKRVTGDTQQGLGKYHPIKPGSTAMPNTPRVFAQSFTPAGATPTAAEIAAALQDVFGGGGEGENSAPRSGDTVNLVRDGAVTQRVQITATDPRPGGTNTPSEVAFTVASKTYYGMVQVGASAADHPFRVIDASDESTQVRVIFGMVNDIAPDYADGESLIAVGGTGYIYLEVTVDADTLEVTAAEVKFAGSLPAATATLGRIALAAVSISGGRVVVNQSVTHSLGHQRCGETTHNFWGV